MIIPKVCPKCGDKRKSLRVHNSFLCCICYDEAIREEMFKKQLAEQKEITRKTKFLLFWNGLVG